MPSVLFFTCATGFYENFVVPYVFFAQKHNRTSLFEFIVDDVVSFSEKHGESVAWLKENLDASILLREVAEMAVKPKSKNSYRFVMEPMSIADFVYIGDVDIMIMEDIFHHHRAVFDYGLPYSNIIRRDGGRLTGLHFSRYDAHYPLGYIDDLIEEETNDEALLFRIVDRKGLLYDSARYRSVHPGRPIHGIHMSLNRLPFSYHKERVGWGARYKWFESALWLCESSEFAEFHSTMYAGAAQVILNVIYLSKGVVELGPEYFEAWAVP